MSAPRDTYLRFSSMGAVRAFFRRAATKGMTGDLFDPEDADRLIDTRRNVAHVILKPGTVVITPATHDDDGNELTPAVTDPRIWVVLRFLGDTAERDRGPGSRWAGSKIIKHIRNNGVAGVKRGVRMARMTFGSNWVEVYHTGDLVERGIVPHVIAGGPM